MGTGMGGGELCEVLWGAVERCGVLLWGAVRYYEYYCIGYCEACTGHLTPSLRRNASSASKDEA